MPYRPILGVMRWLGRAPDVQILTHDQLVDDVHSAGFVDISLPEVGAKDTTVFLVAAKP